MPLLSFQFLSFVIIRTYLFDIDQLPKPIKTLIQIPADSKYAHTVYFYSLLYLILLFIYFIPCLLRQTVSNNE